MSSIGRKIYNYGVKKRNAYLKERETIGKLKADAKELEDFTYHKQLGKELKNKAITKAEARAKRKANQPTRISQIAHAAKTVAHSMPTIRTDGPDPFGLFGNKTSPSKRSKKRRPKKVVYY